jgi:hypothetical protein
MTEKYQTKLDLELSHLKTSVLAIAPRDILHDAMIVLQRKIIQCLIPQEHFKDLNGAQKD